MADYRQQVRECKAWYDETMAEYYKREVETSITKNKMFYSCVSDNARVDSAGTARQIVDTLADVVLKKGYEVKEYLFNTYEKQVGEAIVEMLKTGEGILKINISGGELIIDVKDGENVELIFDDKKYLSEIIFLTYIDRQFRIQEHYGDGYIQTRLFKDNKEVPLTSHKKTMYLSSTYDYSNIYQGKLAFILKSKNDPLHFGRGQSVFKHKIDTLDIIDETLSQLGDSIRSSRTITYIPSSMLPRDTSTGKILKPDSFLGNYIIGSKDGENQKAQVEKSDVRASQYVETLDMLTSKALEGIISPATMGLELGKNNSAESVREKEKITEATRSGIINAITPTLEMFYQVVDLILTYFIDEAGLSPLAEGSTEDYIILSGDNPELRTEIEVFFPEYFDDKILTGIDALSKAYSLGAISPEMYCKILYGDNFTKEEVEQEVQRLIQQKAEVF